MVMIISFTMERGKRRLGESLRRSATREGRAASANPGVTATVDGCYELVNAVD